MKKQISYFKVYHLNNACLGIAKLIDNRATFKADSKAYAWFEERPDNWLKDFQAVVRRLVKSTGHSGRFSITKDETTQIRVELID